MATATGRLTSFTNKPRNTQVRTILITVKALAHVRILLEGLSELPSGASLSVSKP